MKDKVKKSFVMNALRRATYRWPGRWKSEKRSHVGRGEYVCECCGLILSKGETQMDHIQPVIDPVEGWTGFDSVIDRMFVYEDGWQRLCLDCHSVKTLEENSVRKESKSSK